MDIRIDISLPKGWSELSEDQFRFILNLFALNISKSKFLTLCFLEFSGLDLLSDSKTQSDQPVFSQNGRQFTIDQELFSSLCLNLEWILSGEGEPTNFSKIGKYYGCSKDLYDVTLEQYLLADNMFSAFTLTQDRSYLYILLSIFYKKRKEKYNDDIEYLTKKGTYFKKFPIEVMGISVWYAGTRAMLSRKFPALFSGSSGDESNSPEDVVLSIILALNGGDITKNRAIYQSPCIEALSQLNNLAEQSDNIKSI